MSVDMRFKIQRKSLIFHLSALSLLKRAFYLSFSILAFHMCQTSRSLSYAIEPAIIRLSKPCRGPKIVAEGVLL